MKGRVSGEIRQREPGKLETGTEGPAEHGPGAVGTTGVQPQPPTRAHVTAQEYKEIRTPGGPGREAWVKQGGTAKKFVLDILSGALFFRQSACTLAKRTKERYAPCRARALGPHTIGAQSVISEAHVPGNYGFEFICGLRRKLCEAKDDYIKHS